MRAHSQHFFICSWLFIALFSNPINASTASIRGEWVQERTSLYLQNNASCFEVQNAVAGVLRTARSKRWNYYCGRYQLNLDFENFLLIDAPNGDEGSPGKWSSETYTYYFQSFNCASIVRAVEDVIGMLETRKLESQVYCNGFPWWSSIHYKMEVLQEDTIQ